MINKRFLIVMGLSLGLSGYAHATCTGSGDPCNAPRNAAIGTVSPTQIPMSLQNAATPNVTESEYFFQATTLGSAQDAGTLDRNTVIVFTSDDNPGSSSDVIGQTIRPLLANSTYNLWGKVCPPNITDPTNSACSAWVNFGNRMTGPLTNAGFRNIAKGDTAPRQFTARTDATQVVNQQDVVSWIATGLNSAEAGNCSFTKTLQPLVGNGDQLLSIDSSSCGTLVPNRPYALVEHLKYDPTQTAPNFTSGVFYTQAAVPVPGSITSVTHCSATLGFNNSTADPANPGDTLYVVSVGNGIPDNPAVKTTGQTGLANDPGSVTYTDLVPGTPYSPTVTAKNRGGSNWKDNSASYPTGFTTSGTGGNFTPANPAGTTTEDLSFTGVDLTGVISWQIILNGNPFGSLNSGVPTSPIHITGLTPNTAYSVRIKFNETNCNFTIPISAALFTTTPIAPASASFSNVLATSLQVNWVDGSANPTGSTYEIDLCTNSNFTSNCQVHTVNKPTLSTTFTVNPQTTYFAQVLTRNVTRPTWPDSSPTPTTPASVTTPPNDSAISVSPNPGNAVTGTPLTFTGTVTDQTGAAITPTPAITWTYSGGNSQISTTSGASTILNATTAGSFTLTAHLGGVYSDVVVPVTVSNSGTVVATPVLTLNTDNLTGNLSCTATDPGFAEPTLNYAWSVVSPVGATVSYSVPNGSNASKNNVVTFTQAGTYVFRCTATDPASLSGSNTTAPTVLAQALKKINVMPNGITIQSISNQTFTASGLDQFGNAMAFNGTVNWSASIGTFNGPVFQSGGQLGSGVQIFAKNSGVTGTASITIVNFDVSAAYASPVPYKSTSGLNAITFRSLGTDAKIRIYTASGRLVFSHEETSGTYPWGVVNSAGEKVASGVYLYVIESPTTTKHGKLIIIQ